ncbi:cupin domain-containing protein [Dyadobacter aurulentus]|uniref:cupin domain-containing protein n=1 Tax=Dyadobacter sp. UC 10 TaxID=2605428 RepID=UPI0011F182B8|nr:cupin domain-containing protein [Dyadobacter sp. UC 10]KAA0992737.1 cupin domain-containing protein [Dyadobacter sp. UC 10]
MYLKSFRSILLGFAVGMLSSSYVTAQHQHPAETVKSANPLTFSPVLNEYLGDPDLKSYKWESQLMTVTPGGTDTVAHRHDAEVFGYIIEGKLEVGLNKETPKTFTAGQMFHEKRNVLHSFTRNPDMMNPTKVLLIFVIKDGRAGYTREYPPKK